MSRAMLRTRSGSLLVITLWVVTILSVLAIAIARYLSVEVRLTKHRLAREQAKALARSGVYLVMQRLAHDADPQKLPQPYEAYDWLGDGWALPQEDLPVAHGRITVRSVVDEERLLNLNAATKEQIASLTGSSPAATAILAYRDANTSGETPVDEPPYFQKNTPIKAMEELADIPEIDDAARAQVQPLTAVATDPAVPPAINVNTVEEDVLVALGGPTTGDQSTASVVDRVIASRPGVDGNYGTADDCVVTDPAEAANRLAECAQIDPNLLIELFSKATVAVSSSVFRIQVEATAGSPPVRQRIDAIVKRAPDGGQILAWREQ